MKQATGVTRRVPQDYPTIQNGVDAANPGDLVLIDKGEYNEAVFVTTPSVTLRGVDRNAVILDGKFELGTGIMVGGNGVAIENMTARNYTLNGFFWTGVQGFRGSYLTAYNNGDYGIYAFGSTRRAVRAFVRQRLSGLGVLCRSVRALPSGFERRRRQLQRPRLFRNQFERRHVYLEFALRAQSKRHRHHDVRYRIEPAGTRHDDRRQCGQRQRAR